MKIIKQGNKRSTVWEGSCHSCRAVISAEEEELSNIIYDRDGRLCKIKCLCCEKDMWVYPKKYGDL